MKRQFFGAFLVVLCVTVAVRGAGSDVADAVMRGDLAAARALIQKGADVNAPQGDKATALHWAVYRDSVEAVDMLVRAGAKSSPNREGMTPLDADYDQKTSEVNLNYIIRQFNARVQVYYRDTRFDAVRPNTKVFGVGMQVQM